MTGILAHLIDVKINYYKDNLGQRRLLSDFNAGNIPQQACYSVEMNRLLAWALPQVSAEFAQDYAGDTSYSKPLLWSYCTHGNQFATIVSQSIINGNFDLISRLHAIFYALGSPEHGAEIQAPLVAQVHISAGLTKIQSGASSIDVTDPYMELLLANGGVDGKEAAEIQKAQNQPIQNYVKEYQESRKQAMIRMVVDLSGTIANFIAIRYKITDLASQVGSMAAELAEEWPAIADLAGAVISAAYVVFVCWAAYELTSEGWNNLSTFQKVAVIGALTAVGLFKITAAGLQALVRKVVGEATYEDISNYCSGMAGRDGRLISEGRSATRRFFARMAGMEEEVF